MDLYIDLLKGFGKLDLGKLVKKQVQVHGKNGKIFTRMQWVNPNDASTGHGVRSMKTQQHLDKFRQQGGDKHPSYKEALKDQGLDPEDPKVHKEHQLFLPETHESKRNKYAGGHSEDEHHHDGKHIDHEEYSSKSHAAKENNTSQIAEIPDPLADIVNNIQSLPDSDFSNIQKFITQGIHWKVLKNHANDYIESLDAPDSIKKIKRGILENNNIQSSTWGSLCLNKHVLSASLHNVLGSEKLGIFRKILKNSTLTINYKTKNADTIKTHGYHSRNSMDFVQDKLKDRDLEAFNALKDLDGVDEVLEKMVQWRSSINNKDLWDYTTERIIAEVDTMGIEPFIDNNPIYVAYNPANSEQGACTDYGAGVLHIDTDILKHSTVGVDDTYQIRPSEMTPHVEDLDHLTDMFILKAVYRKTNNQGEVPDTFQGAEELYLNAGIIPLEIQYHQKTLPENQYTIFK